MSKVSKDLRQSVLQAAIQGKLTEQLATDGTTKELLDKIGVKPIADTSGMPFDIPNGWEWVKHNDLFEIVGGSQPPKSDFKEQPFVNSVRLYQIRDYGNKPVPIYVDKSKVSKFSQKGEILLARYGASLGKVFRAEDGAYNVAMAKVTRLYENIDVSDDWLHYFFLSSLYQNLVKSSNRAAQAGFNKDDLNSLFIPLPPLAEQERIVAKVDELMKEIDELEKMENELGSIKKAFPDDMKSALLQAAMKGELTERLATDGTAKELLDKIGVKPIADTGDMPFDIPDGWEWCKLDDTCTYISTGNSISENIKKDKYMKTIPNGLSYIGTKDVGFNGIVDYDNGVMIPLKEPKFRVAKAKSTLLCIEGGSAGKKIAIIDKDVCYGNKLCAFTFNVEFNAKFLHYWLQTPAFLKMFNGNVSGMIGGVSQKKIKGLNIPIPPLPEQERIVAQLDKLLPLCENLF